jgi:DNA-binding CsgD family transcriptional regulator
MTHAATLPHPAAAMSDAEPALTPAEREVAELLAAGYSVGQVAATRRCTEYTVRALIRTAGTKLPGFGHPIRRMVLWAHRRAS